MVQILDGLHCNSLSISLMIIIGIFLIILERIYGVTFDVPDTRKAVDPTPNNNGGLAVE